MLHEKKDIRSFKQVLNKNKEHCSLCGLIKNDCLCIKGQLISSQSKFLLLTHEREMMRTSNTGRLIEDTIEGTLTIVWDRSKPDESLMAYLVSDLYQVYLIFPGDRDEEKKKVVSYEKNNKIPLFLIIDGTWKEARKILRKSDYLKDLPILDLKLENKTRYFLRRNSEEKHLCTAEVAVALLDLINDQNAKNYLNAYFKRFLTLYEKGRKNENN